MHDANVDILAVAGLFDDFAESSEDLELLEELREPRFFGGIELSILVLSNI